MSQPAKARTLWLRADLRLTIAAGLTNGFALLSGVPFGYYATLAVLTSSAKSYGLSLALGRQRVLGSLLGAVVLLICYEGLRGVPFPLAIAIALGLQRLLGGLLRLEVGYKVGGMIIVMGWLVHNDQFSQWLPLRMFWTAFGIATALLCMRLLWPASALRDAWRGWADLLDQLAIQLQQPSGLSADPRLRKQLMAMRAALPAIRDELGGAGRDHPVVVFMSDLDESCSRLIGLVGALKRAHSAVASHDDVKRQLRAAELALSQALGARVSLWAGCLRSRRGRHGHRLPSAPQMAWALPELWSRADLLMDEPVLDARAVQRWMAVAERQQLCRQAIEILERTELVWRQACR